MCVYRPNNTKLLKIKILYEKDILLPSLKLFGLKYEPDRWLTWNLGGFPV